MRIVIGLFILFSFSLKTYAKPVFNNVSVKKELSFTNNKFYQFNNYILSDLLNDDLIDYSKKANHCVFNYFSNGIYQLKYTIFNLPKKFLFSYINKCLLFKICVLRL